MRSTSHHWLASSQCHPPLTPVLCPLSSVLYKQRLRSKPLAHRHAVASQKFVDIHDPLAGRLQCAKQHGTVARLDHQPFAGGFQHLARLRRDNLVKTRRSAQTIYYSLAGPEARAVIETLYGLYCGAPSAQAVEAEKVVAGA